MSKSKSAILYIVLTVLSVVFLFVCNRITSKDAKMFTSQISSATHRYIARVDSILDTSVTAYDTMGRQFTKTTTKFSGSVLFGEDKGLTVIATQSVDDMMHPPPKVAEVGDWIFVTIDAQVSTDYLAGNYIRIDKIVIIALVFFALLILFAGFRGLTTIIALVSSVLSIFLVFIPAILSGRNIYFWAIVICLYTITIMPFYVAGFNQKSIASAMGCFGGVAIAGILTYFLNSWLSITGAIDEETMFVSMISETEPINLRAIVFAAILIGALGATVDVSISIASPLNEMIESGGSVSFSKLFKSGLAIGRDIIGAQTSTLVLAYVGGSLSLVVLLVAYQPSIMETLNLEAVIVELLQMLIGGFVVLFTIPATALFSAMLFERQGKMQKQKKHVF